MVNFILKMAQIILTGFCQELAFEALEGVAQQFQILVHDDNCRCYVVVPGISEEQFFTEIVSVVDHAVGGVDISEGEYSIRRKIPPSPKLPQGISDAKAERISGEICRKATIHFGRGYGHRFSKVEISLSSESPKIYYCVQRMENKIGGEIEDGKLEFFSGRGAQWDAVRYAYDIDQNDNDPKEAARRAKGFAHAIVGQLMERFDYNSQLAEQPHFLDQWQKTHSPVGAGA
jgi:hypothetical protein